MDGKQHYRSAIYTALEPAQHGDSIHCSAHLGLILMHLHKERSGC